MLDQSTLSSIFIRKSSSSSRTVILRFFVSFLDHLRRRHKVCRSISIVLIARVEPQEQFEKDMVPTGFLGFQFPFSLKKYRNILFTNKRDALIAHLYIFQNKSGKRFSHRDALYRHAISPSLQSTSISYLKGPEQTTEYRLQSHFR